MFEQAKGRVVIPDDSHDFFDQLCALSAAGQISSDEQRVLAEHLQSCPSCKESLEQYDEVVFRTSESTRAFRALENPPAWEESVAPAEHQRAKARLMLRIDEIDTAAAHRTSSPVRTWTRLIPSLGRVPLSVPKWATWGLAAGLVVTVPLGSWVLSKRMNVHQQATSESSPKSPESKRQIDDLRQQLAIAQSNRQKLQASAESAAAESKKLRAENSQLRLERSQFESLAARQASDYANLNNRIRLLQSSLDAAQASSINLENEKKDLLAKVSDLKAALRDSQDEVTRVGARNQELNQQSLTQVRYVQRQQKLLATDHDLRDILGARSLRIIDVYDVGSKGDFELPFGRIFYTEGKSLIFYAFDLDLQKGLKPGAVFQAWGMKEQAKDTPHSLGAFYMDDPLQNRWILKVDDARLLSRVDYVFVSDSRKEGSKPHGKPLLSAFLDSRINHP